MKIEGKLNIMGLREIIFYNKVVRDGNVIVRYEYYEDGNIGSFKWGRVGPDNCYTSDKTIEDVVRNINALAKNPNVELTFNDGAMYVVMKK